MKKKCLSLILGIMLVLSLGSCGKESVTTSGCAEQEMVKDDTTSSTPKAKREDSASKLADIDSNEGNHAEVKIVMIGDILLHEPVMAAFLQEDGSYDFSALFDDTRALSQNSDLAILNQETILGGSELGVSGYPAFNSPQEVGDAEVDAGYNTILSATNHALDRGEGAIRKDISYWKEKHPDVTLLGLHEDEADAEKIRVVEKNGIRIAILNYTYGTEYDGNALYELGYLYENRGENPENLEKAADYYQKAIEMGNENAVRRFSHFKKSLFGRWKLVP